MAQTKEGAIKCAAKKLNISVEKYLALTKSGLKHCTKCKLWKRRNEFGNDRSRFDGQKAKCKSCVYQRIKPFTKQEYSDKKKQGLAWCVDCQMWRSIEEINNSRCVAHHRACERNRYMADADYRFSRKQKTSQRRRNVDAVPPEGEERLLIDFNGVCAYCDNPATTYDHITPVSKGGITKRSNIVPACRSCNSSKNNKDVLDWLQETGKQPKEEWYEILLLEYVWY